MTAPRTQLGRLRLAHKPPIRNNSALATMAGVDKSAITRLERGDAGELVHFKVARVFGLTPEEFAARLDTKDAA